MFKINHVTFIVESEDPAIYIRSNYMFYDDYNEEKAEEVKNNLKAYASKEANEMVEYDCKYNKEEMVQPIVEFLHKRIDDLFVAFKATNKSTSVEVTEEELQKICKSVKDTKKPMENSAITAETQQMIAQKVQSLLTEKYGSAENITNPDSFVDQLEDEDIKKFIKDSIKAELPKPVKPNAPKQEKKKATEAAKDMEKTTEAKDTKKSEEAVDTNPFAILDGTSQVTKAEMIPIICKNNGIKLPKEFISKKDITKEKINEIIDGKIVLSNKKIKEARGPINEWIRINTLVSLIGNKYLESKINELGGAKDDKIVLREIKCEDAKYDLSFEVELKNGYKAIVMVNTIPLYQKIKGWTTLISVQNAAVKAA